MKNNHEITKKQYDELYDKYIQLEQRYKKQTKRINSIIKMNDRNFKIFFNKSVTADKIDKRIKVILKQSDKQSKHWLVENDKKDKFITKQSKMADMGEMIGNIAHQMKQPLSIILTSSTALELKKEMNILTDKEFLEFTNNINKTTQYLSETIDSFRNFFNDDRTKQELSIDNIIIRSKQLLESKFKGQNIKIIHELDDVKVFGVENDLIQVFTNLFSNSIDALAKKESDKLIFITSVVQKDNTIIEFGDSAGGIKEDIINNVFKMHFSTKSKENGSGIGLHMTRMIIENKFNGTIDVENQSTQYKNKTYTGAYFKINIPK